MSIEEKLSQTANKNNTDQPDGLHKELFTNGKPSGEGQYINGKHHGKWKIFYENGVVKAILIFSYEFYFIIHRIRF